MSMLSVTQLEKRIIWISLAFIAVLLGLSALGINLFHVGLPTCLTDVKPFQKGELITHSKTYYELHYVARMCASLSFTSCYSFVWCDVRRPTEHFP